MRCLVAAGEQGRVRGVQGGQAECPGAEPGLRTAGHARRCHPAGGALVPDRTGHSSEGLEEPRQAAGGCRVRCRQCRQVVYPGEMPR